MVSITFIIILIYKSLIIKLVIILIFFKVDTLIYEINIVKFIVSPNTTFVVLYLKCGWSILIKF